jgi:hypothetical protein
LTGCVDDRPVVDPCFLLMANSFPGAIIPPP